jgi:hypothetical protein
MSRLSRTNTHQPLSYCYNAFSSTKWDLLSCQDTPPYISAHPFKPIRESNRGLISGFRRDVDESALFWDIAQRWVVILYRRFGATYRSYLQGTSWPLNMGPIGCPETSVQNYHSTLRNIAEERRSRAVGFFNFSSVLKVTTELWKQ